MKTLGNVFFVKFTSPVTKLFFLPRYESPTELITIEESESGQNTRKIPLPRQTVKLTLSVSDNESIPLAGIELVLVPVSHLAREKDAIIRAISDENGNVVFTELPVGEKYKVDILDERY